MKRLSNFLFACLLACSITLPINQIHASTDVVTIRIVHTNDIHGRSKQQQNVIGFEKLATWIKAQQADFVVDAGDVLHGQAFATIQQGESMMRLLQAVGYDAITPGNHDWNYGKDQLLALSTQYQIPVLAANVKSNQTSFFGNDGYIIKTIDGVKVGMFGVFDQDIKDDTAPRNIEGLTFESDAMIATNLAQQLRNEGCDVVVALSHQLDVPSFVANTKGIDAVIAGHEHTVLATKYQDGAGNDVTVVETGSFLQTVGKLSIQYDKRSNKITSMTEETLSTSQAEQMQSDEQVATLIATMEAQQNVQLDQQVGKTEVALDGTWEELRVDQTAMGTIIAQSYLDETGADIAFENAGGIRIGRVLTPGSITYRDLVDTSPFGNYIVTKQISGAGVLSILEDSIELGVQNKKAYDEWKQSGSDQVKWPDDHGSYLQFAGIEANIDLTKQKGERVISIAIQGKPLQQETQYTIATNNYISLGKAYPQLAKAKELHQYAACDEALLHFFSQEESVINNVALSKVLNYTSDAVKEEAITPQTPIIKDTSNRIFDHTLLAGVTLALYYYLKRQKEA